MNCLTGDAHDLRIVLLGVSGAGKSSMGNAILGREAFKESRTRESEIQKERVEDRNISIINTPGFFNAQLTDEELQKQMMKSQDLSDPGPHVFLLIINLKNFEEDERNIVNEIEEIFGAQALKFTMVLFIGRERMSNQEWNDFTLSEKFQGLVSTFREQYHEINSKDEIDQTHIKKLLKKIDEFIEQNDGQHFNKKSTKEKKKQEEEKKYTKKEQEQERPQQVLRETFQMNSAMEEEAKHAVFEPENVRQRKKTTDEEANLQRKEFIR
ncbi:GTPase IMAP family member 4 [Anabarilius grahami]|uniref:GTPase IMAP family member 8 n=1 Tax=Anabarilius grahami TaxID=495550 RepID=A0A3N0YRN6_ANAGA|nr:GTPase IMAP family member 4 [Anabarilius grahami]